MTLRTLALYLIGNREAILQIVATKHALWLGFLFVLSAGFAREYDGEDLLHEPWHLLIPLGASLATCTLLFVVLYVVVHGWRTIPNHGHKFTELLTLYWMTAPLAWVYAVPVERILNPGHATSVNLWLLGLVALWRVVLIMQVASVLFAVPFSRVIAPVLLFGDSVMLVLISVMPRPILAVMGGVRLTESEAILQNTTFFLQMAGGLTWPFWAVATVIVLFRSYDRRAPTTHSPMLPASVASSAWILAGAALLMGIGVLPFTQPEQQRRYHAERLFKIGQIAEGLKFLSSQPRSAFPPYWDPPPRIAFQWNKIVLVDTVTALDALPAETVAPWVRDVYRDKLSNQLGTWHYPWDDLSEEQIERTLYVLDRFKVDVEIDYDGLVRQTWESSERSQKLKTRISEFLHARGRFLPKASEEKPEAVGEETHSGD